MGSGKDTPKEPHQGSCEAEGLGRELGGLPWSMKMPGGGSEGVICWSNHSGDFSELVVRGVERCRMSGVALEKKGKGRAAN